MILRKGARGALGEAKTNGRYVNESATVKKLEIKSLLSGILDCR